MEHSVEQKLYIFIFKLLDTKQSKILRNVLELQGF
jgi:hypothetical protein